MFNIPAPQGGTSIAKTKSLWPNPLKPKLELNSNSPGLMHQSLYNLPDLCKQYNGDMIK